MKKTPLRKISAKTKARNERWAEIKAAKIEELTNQFGYPMCEWCGGEGHLDDFESRTWLAAHHKDWHRDNCTKENIFICHNSCHDYIHANNIRRE